MDELFDMIVHISGSPGSGKTTLGQELSLIYPNIIVKDTDDFTNNISQNNGPLFVKELTNRIQLFIEEHPNNIIILVGILDITDNGITYIVDMKKITQHLFYLDVPIEQLLRQFYTRIVNLSIWEDIVKGYYIPSSNEKIKESNITRQVHLNLGYQSMSKITIMDTIRNLTHNMIQCIQCGSVPDYPQKCGGSCNQNDIIYCNTKCQSIHWFEGHATVCNK